MNEHQERLLAMRDDDNQTWDLSDKDREAIAWVLERADEAERLLRLVCLRIVDGIEDESLAEMRSHQSSELADISLAIETAWTRVMTELTIKENVIAKMQERRSRDR